MRCQETETDSAVTNGGGVPWDVGLEVNTNELHLESNAGSETADSPSRGRRKLGLLDALAQGDSRPRRALVSREVGVPNNGIRLIAHCHQTPAVGQGRTRPAQAPRRPAPEPRGAHNGAAAARDSHAELPDEALSRRRRSIPKRACVAPRHVIEREVRAEVVRAVGSTASWRGRRLVSPDPTLKTSASEAGPLANSLRERSRALSDPFSSGGSSCHPARG